MKKVPTKEQYQQMVRNMPTKELMGLAEIFELFDLRNPREELIKNVIDAEVERRIYNWEIAEV